MIKNQEELNLWVSQNLKNPKREFEKGIKFILTNDLEIEIINNRDVISLEFNENFKEFPLKIVDVIDNGLEIIAPNLESLKNFPKQINGFLSLVNTKIDSLENLPKIIKGYIFLIDNKNLTNFYNLYIPISDEEDFQTKILYQNEDFKINEKFTKINDEYDKYENLYEINYSFFDNFMLDYGFNEELYDCYLNDYNL